MRGFDVKFIDELKNKNDLIDVVGRYVRLEQRGGNFWGKCPFHHEKTASFCVNADLEELMGIIHPCGFYKNKAKNIIASSKDIISRFDGKIPSEIDDLITLAGVGRKF